MNETIQKNKKNYKRIKIYAKFIVVIFYIVRYGFIDVGFYLLFSGVLWIELSGPWTL